MTETLLEINQDNDLLPELDPNKSYKEELVGENKKFKDEEALARGKYESDLYIKTLLRQQDELRADYLRLREEATTAPKLKEILDQIELKQQQLASSDENTHKANEVKDQPVIKPEDIESLVSKKIQEHDVSKKQSENFSVVKAKLKEILGDNYQGILKEQMVTLGLTEEDINSLARKSPMALLRTLGLDKQEAKETFQAPFRSSLRSDNFVPKTQKRTWSYYQNLKATNPMLYLDPKTTVQMHKDYEELGVEFEDGNFKQFG